MADPETIYNWRRLDDAAKAVPGGHLASLRDAVLLRPADAFSLRR